MSLERRRNSGTLIWQEGEEPAQSVDVVSGFPSVLADTWDMWDVFDVAPPMPMAGCLYSNPVPAVTATVAIYVIPVLAQTYYPLMDVEIVATQGEGEVELHAPFVDWDTSAIYYRCTLTGAADGMPDIVLPISSFQTRSRKNPRPSYLSVIVPNATLHLPHIIARPNGEIVIEQGRMYPDGIEYDDLVRADYESCSYNEGARNSSITLTGHRTLTPAPAQIVPLRGVSIVAMQMTGVRRVTAAVDFRVRAGDTVTWDGQSMVAGMVAIAVGRHHATMTITEAE